MSQEAHRVCATTHSHYKTRKRERTKASETAATTLPSPVPFELSLEGNEACLKREIFVLVSDFPAVEKLICQIGHKTTHVLAKRLKLFRREKVFDDKESFLVVLPQLGVGEWFFTEGTRDRLINKQNSRVTKQKWYCYV